MESLCVKNGLYLFGFVLLVQIKVFQGATSPLPPYHVRMCQRNTNTAGLFVLGNDPVRINSDCACQIKPISNNTNTRLVISLRDFQCSRACEWKLRLYVGGCLRFETCCDPYWKNDQVVQISARDYTINSDVYLSHENVYNDPNGSRLNVHVLSIQEGILSNTGTTQNPESQKSIMECGKSVWNIRTKPSSQCVTTPGTTPGTTPARYSTTTTLPSSLPGKTTVKEDNITEEPTSQTSEAKGGTHWLTGLTLIGVITGCIAALLVIIIVGTAITVCIFRRRQESSSSAASQRTTSEWLSNNCEAQSTYSYSRSLPPAQVPGPKSLEQSSRSSSSNNKKYPECFDPPPNPCYYKYADTYKP